MNHFRVINNIVTIAANLIFLRNPDHRSRRCRPSFNNTKVGRFRVKTILVLTALCSLTVVFGTL